MSHVDGHLARTILSNFQKQRTWRMSWSLSSNFPQVDDFKAAARQGLGLGGGGISIWLGEEA